MKPFNLTEYLKDPSKEVITRDGRAVKIHCTNYCSSNFPIVAEIEGWNYSDFFTREGHYDNSNKESPNDLFFASGKHCEGWVNVYHEDNQLKCGNVYNTESGAKLHGRNANRLATVKIEWEE